MTKKSTESVAASSPSWETLGAFARQDKWLAEYLNNVRLQDAAAKVMLGAAIVDDILGLLILAIVTGIAQTGSVSIASVTVLSAKAIIFLVVAMLLGVRLALVLIARAHDPMARLVELHEIGRPSSWVPTSPLTDANRQTPASRVTQRTVCGTATELDDRRRAGCRRTES